MFLYLELAIFVLVADTCTLLALSHGWVGEGVAAKSGRQLALAIMSKLVKMWQLCARFARLKIRKQIYIKILYWEERQGYALWGKLSQLRPILVCHLAGHVWAFSVLSPRLSQSTYHSSFIQDSYTLPLEVVFQDSIKYWDPQAFWDILFTSIILYMWNWHSMYVSCQGCSALVSFALDLNSLSYLPNIISSLLCVSVYCSVSQSNAHLYLLRCSRVFFFCFLFLFFTLEFLSSSLMWTLRPKPFCER